MSTLALRPDVCQTWHRMNLSSRSSLLFNSLRTSIRCNSVLQRKSSRDVNSAFKKANKKTMNLSRRKKRLRSRNLKKQRRLKRAKMQKRTASARKKRSKRLRQKRSKVPKSTSRSSQNSVILWPTSVWVVEQPPVAHSRNDWKRDIA